MKQDEISQLKRRILTLRDDGEIVQPHPQATTKFAREQGYIIARVEEWCRGTYGQLFEAAPQLLAACEAVEAAEKHRSEQCYTELYLEAMRQVRVALLCLRD